MHCSDRLKKKGFGRSVAHLLQGEQIMFNFLDGISFQLALFNILLVMALCSVVVLCFCFSCLSVVTPLY